MTPEQHKVASDVYGAVRRFLHLFYVEDYLKFLRKANATDNKTFEFLPDGFRIYLESSDISYNNVMASARALSEMYSKKFVPGSIGHVNYGTETLLYVEFKFRRQGKGS